MKKRHLIQLFIILIPAVLISSINETLPSWHWAYDYIDELRLRGCFETLYFLNRLYTRGEVAEAILSSQEKLDRGELHLSNSDRRLLDRLAEEFQEEIKSLQEKADDGGSAQVGVRFQSDLAKQNEGSVKYRGIYRSKLGVAVGSHITAYNGINFDQYLVDDSMYVGKKWRGIVGYTEQAYVSIHFNYIRLMFGRDFLHWGAGKSGSLLFSDISRPMDQLKAMAHLGPFQYTYITSMLDDHQLDGVMADCLGGSTAQRYLSAHRLDVHLFSCRLQCAVTEAIVYGGVNRQIDWVYLNPFIFYHGEQMNKSGSGNTMGTVDVLTYPLFNWELYGSLLIDDVQIEKTGPGDLEPSEVGLLLGSRYGNPLHIPGMTLSGEYVRVANRTYKTPNPWETFIHMNDPLGHPLGNDFDSWRVGLSQWFMGSLRIKLIYSQTRKGESSLFTPFDTPWFDHSVEEGYSEPFPTGVVEKINQIDFHVQYYPSVHWGLEAELHSIRRTNAFHVEGVSNSETTWRIGVWFDGEIMKKLN